MRELISINVGIWKRYETYNFVIAPSLAGAWHEYKYENHYIRIQLPKKPRKRDWYNDNSSITCSQYRVRNGSKIPSNYVVHSVVMIIDPKKTTNIPKNALEKIDTSLFNSTERKRLDNISDKYSQIMDSAFDSWVNVIRWKSGIYNLCQLRYNRQLLRCNPYVLNMTTGKRFYTGTHVIIIEKDQVVSKKAWSLSEDALVKNINVPVWHLYYVEAKQKLNLGDIRGFILDLTIAIETLIRKVVRTKLVAKSTHEFFKDRVDKIPVTHIFNNWFKLGFKSKSWSLLKNDATFVKDVKEVIQLRNGVMHRGEHPHVSRKRGEQLSKAVHRFLIQGEKEI